MKKKTLKLTVPTPCDTSSKEMFRALDGKFCKGCKRVVVDFKKMSDRQLMDYFTNHHGKICGEFRPGQLNRDITIQMPSGWDALRQKASAVAAVTSLTLTVPIAQMNAQTCHEIPEQQVRGKLNPDSIPKDNQQNGHGGELKISGMVRDTAGKPILYANVIVTGTSIGTVTDVDGLFTLSVPLREGQNQVIPISVSYLGYITSITNIEPLKYQNPIKIVLIDSFPLLGEMVAGGISYEVDAQVPEEDTLQRIAAIAIEKGDSLSVFPNPFAQSFHIAVELLKKDSYELFLFDEAGKIYWADTRKLRKGSNEFEVNIQTPLPAGNYVFHMRSKEMQLSEILVKAD